MMKTSFLKRGACILATAALATAIVPAAALADSTQTTTGGSTEVTSSSHFPRNTLPVKVISRA